MVRFIKASVKAVNRTLLRNRLKRWISVCFQMKFVAVCLWCESRRSNTGFYDGGFVNFAQFQKLNK